MRNSLQKAGKDTIFTATGDIRNSGGASGGGITYSTLANVPKAKRVKLVQESKPMLGGAKKCREIWQGIRKADFRKEGILNETNINLVFDKNKDTI